MQNNYLINGPVTHESISLFLRKIGENKDSGAHSVFFGQVRADEISGKKVKAIEYSAYEKLVKVEAGRIIKTVLSEFNDVTSIELLHSTGSVNAGEISLFVVVSAGHRHQAIQACSRTVELVKEKLPVWKREIFEDNSHEWK